MIRRMHDDDELMYTLTASGKFSVSEYVNKFRANRPKKEWSDMVWNKYTSLRVNIMHSIGESL